MNRQWCRLWKRAEQRGKRLVDRIGLSRGLPGAILIAVLGIVPATAGAESKDNAAPGARFDQELVFAVGGFFPYVESEFTINGTGGRSNPEFSGEDDLGLDSSTISAWVGFDWRFLPRHQLQAEWFQLNRSGNRSAQRDLSFGDTTATVGASLSSKIALDIGRLTYGYSVLRNERHDLAVLVGAHIFTAKATISASGAISVNGGPVMSGSSSVSSSTYTFPLPHIGAQYAWKFAPRWTMDLRLLGFALEVDQYSGYLVEADGLVSYQLTKNFGLGGGLKYFKLNLQGQGDNLSAEYNFQFFGPAVFGYVSF